MQGGFHDRFWSGVNLGSTTPGHLPGEVSARASTTPLVPGDGRPRHREHALIGLDLRPGANKALPKTESAMPAADVALRLDGDEVRFYRAGWTDALAFQYASTAST